MAATGPVSVDSEEYKKKVQAFMDANNLFEYEGVWFPSVTSPEILQHLKNFEVRTDDLILATYPKCAAFGNWWDHALSYWEHRNDDNVCFVTFEEMKKDLRSVVRRLEKFLGLTVTPEGMERIVEHSSVEGMKKTYAKIEEDHEDGKMYTRGFGITPIIQKGVSGGWKAQFTDKQSEQMDSLTKAKLTGTGLDAHYH